MINAAFYVFDQALNQERLIQYCLKKNISKVFLCPVTTNQDVISLIVGRLSSLMDCEVIPFLGHFNKLAFLERNNFIRFISEFAEKPRFGSVSFKRYFRYPHSSFSAWWFSLIAEKNPQKSGSYHNLIKLLSILKLRQEYNCKRILLDIESGGLSYTIMHNSKNSQYECIDFRRHLMKPQIIYLLINFLKGMRYFFYLIYKFFIVQVKAGGLNHRQEILRDARYIAVTYFPLLDKKSLKEGRFVNKYYGSLQTVLESRHKDNFIWLAMAPGIDDFSFKDSVQLGRQLNLRNYPIYFLEEWVGLRDFLSIMAHYLYFTMKCIIKIPYLSKKFEYSEERINLWNIFKEDWISSFAGDVLMKGIFYFRAFNNISQKIKTGATVLYLAENHNWEKTLNFTFHQNKDLKIVGILHTTVPLLFLPFFDFGSGLEKEDRKTMPDYLACNGKVPLELIQKNGWDKKRTFLCPAVRYEHLKKYLGKKIPWESRQNKISVVLSCNVKESKELLCYIHQAFRGQENYQIIIKGHYALASHSIVRGLNLDFDKDVFVFSDKELESILSSVKAAVVTGSSAALESVALGCPVIIPRLSSVIDTNPLSGISDLPFYVNSPKELLSTADEIIKKGEPSLFYEKCKDFIENYFEFSDWKNELIEKIESRSVIDGEIL